MRFASIVGAVGVLLALGSVVGCGAGGGSDAFDDGPLPPPTFPPLASAVHAASHDGEDCASCHTTWDIPAIHDRNSSAFDDDCVKCHGYMLDEPTLMAGVVGPHQVMIPAFLGPQGAAPTKVMCTGCHVRTDFREGSGGDIRRQTFVSGCAACHTEGGPADPALYQD